MIVKQVSANVQRFGVAVKDDGYGHLCLANLMTGNLSVKVASSWFKDLAYPGKYNVYARHTYAKNGGQGAGMFAYATSLRYDTFYPCWEQGVSGGGVTQMLKTARPINDMVRVVTYGEEGTVPINPISPYNPNTDTLTIRPLGVSTLYKDYREIDGYDTALGSMLCVFDQSHSYMVAQLITLRTRNSQGINESFIESHCGVIGGGLVSMQWGHTWLMPYHEGYIDQSVSMISSMATGIPAPPADTTSDLAIRYGPWTYHKSVYNGETTYFCMRYVYMGRHPGGTYSRDKAFSLMEPGLYCDASLGPVVVETVVAAAEWS